MNERRVYLSNFHDRAPGTSFVKRKVQPPVHRVPSPEDRERGEIDLRRLAAAAAAELEEIEQKRRARAVATTLAGADARALAKLAAPAIARLRGSERQGGADPSKESFPLTLGPTRLGARGARVPDLKTSSSYR